MVGEKLFQTSTKNGQSGGMKKYFLVQKFSKIMILSVSQKFPVFYGVFFDSRFLKNGRFWGKKFQKSDIQTIIANWPPPHLIFWSKCPKGGGQLAIIVLIEKTP